MNLGYAIFIHQELHIQDPGWLYINFTVYGQSANMDPNV